MKSFCVSVLVTIITFTLLFIADTPEAGAATVVGPGAKITPTLVYEGHCTLAALGYNNSGELIALTAAHCSNNEPVGAPMYLYGSKQLLGHMVVINKALDYMVIKVAPGIVPSSVGGGVKVDRVAPPVRLFQVGCKSGQASGVTCGASVPSGNLVRSFAYMTKGDSGGPYVVGTGLAGITVRIDWAVPPFTAVSIQAVLRDYGKGFTPVR